MLVAALSLRTYIKSLEAKGVAWITEIKQLSDTTPAQAHRALQYYELHFSMR